ncbi:MAG TPA: methyltransferase domain-containing protein [Myxococcaceae bacterium]
MESRRFRTAAMFYAVGRPLYPKRFVANVAEAAGLTRKDRILDLGTGPGVLALVFAPYVGSVLALDPEPEMLRMAREAVAFAEVQVEVREGSSETLGPELGTFRAVTMGRSFHWMDRLPTLARLDRIIEPRGSILLFNDELAEVPENAALQAWRKVVERYSADDRVRMERKAPEWQNHEAVLRASPFSRLEWIRERHRSSSSLQTLRFRALSMSATSEERLGHARAEAMLAEIQAALEPFGDELTETYDWTAIVARRPAG